LLFFILTFSPDEYQKKSFEKMNTGTLLSAIFKCNRLNHQTHIFLKNSFKNHCFAQQKKQNKKQIVKFWCI